MQKKPGILRVRRAAALAFSLLIGTALTPAYAVGVQSVTIVNGTRTVMVALQLRPTGGVWSEILDRKRLSIRQSILFKLPSGQCTSYEIRAVFDDGHVVNKTKQNLCKSPYLLTDF